MYAQKKTNVLTPTFSWGQFFEAAEQFVVDSCVELVPGMAYNEIDLLVRALNYTFGLHIKTGSGPDAPEDFDCKEHLMNTRELLERSDSSYAERPCQAVSKFIEAAGEGPILVGIEYLNGKAPGDAVPEDILPPLFLRRSEGRIMGTARYYRNDEAVSSEGRRVMDVLAFYGNVFCRQELPRILDTVNTFFDLPKIAASLIEFVSFWAASMEVPDLANNTPAALGAFIQHRATTQKSEDINDGLAEEVVGELLRILPLCPGMGLDELLPFSDDFAEADNEGADDWNTDELTMDELYQVLDQLCDLGYLPSIWAQRDMLSEAYPFRIDVTPIQRVLANCKPCEALNSERPGLEMPAAVDIRSTPSVLSFMGSITPALCLSEKSLSILLSFIDDVRKDVEWIDETLLCAIGGFTLPRLPGRREAAVNHFPTFASVSAAFFTDGHIYLATCTDTLAEHRTIEPKQLKEVSISVNEGYGDDVPDQLHEPYAKLQFTFRSIDDTMPMAEDLSPPHFEMYLPRHSDEQLLQLSGYIQFALKEMGTPKTEVVFQDEDDM